LAELADFGYVSYWEVMNAKNHGVPQNRERVFCLSVLGEHEPFEFPKEEELDKRLKDVLEPTVDDKFVLSDKAMEGFLDHNENHEKKQTGFV
jgi:DNA (cytosine-5)-methyltransferase 1